MISCYTNSWKGVSSHKSNIEEYKETNHTSSETSVGKRTWLFQCLDDGWWSIRRYYSTSLFMTCFILSSIWITFSGSISVSFGRMVAAGNRVEFFNSRDDRIESGLLIRFSERRWQSTDDVKPMNTN